MDIESACARCWKSFSCTTPGLIPRLLNCGHSLCTDCLGKPLDLRLLLIVTCLNSGLVDAGNVLSQDHFKGLNCPQCGAAQSLTGKAGLVAVPQNHSVMESLQRLHCNGAIGGLLPSEALKLRPEQLGNSQNSAAYSGVLKMHHQQVQVWYALTLCFVCMYSSEAIPCLC